MLLQKIKITYRLSGAFGILLCCLLVGLSMGVFELSRQNDRTGVIINKNWVVVKKAIELKELPSDGANAMLDLFRVDDPDDMEKLIDRDKKNRKDFNQIVEELRKILVETKYVVLFKKITTAQKEYEASIDKVVALFLQAHRAQAIEKLSAEGMVKLKPLKAALQELIETQNKAMSYACKEQEADYKRSRLKLLGLGGGALFVGCIMALFVTHSILEPLGGAGKAVGLVTKGDLTATLAEVGRDELNQIARQINGMVRGLNKTFTNIRITAEDLQKDSIQLGEASSQVNTNSEQTTSQIEQVTLASNTVSNNISSVAAAAEEISIAVRHIAKQTADASGIAGRAVDVATVTNNTISNLGTASREIGSVIKTISTIAQQTNLLALNATIEAARAGDAGKGFAVVANEVKELARQTASATENITVQISLVQSLTGEAVRAISEITEIINQINGIQSIIAGAIEEQAATTSEISKLTANASSDSMEISNKLTNVSQAAQSSTLAAVKTSEASDDLKRVAQELNELVSHFKLSSKS